MAQGYLCRSTSQQDDDHAAPEDKQEDENLPTPVSNERIAPPSPWDTTLHASRLSYNGNFMLSIECPPIREEGMYRIEVKLGVRDVRGGEWDVPLEDGPYRSIQVQVSRGALE